MRHCPSLPLLAAAVLAAACSGSTTTGPSSATLPATRLASVSPQGGAIGVSDDAIITLGFDGAMMAGMEQYVDLHQGDASGPLHPMTCSWSTDRATLTCMPTTALQSGAQYTLHLGAGMLSSGNTHVDMGSGLNLGGTWLMSGMMGGTHAGRPMSMMGGDWQGANGSYGMLFAFTTS